MPHIYYTTEIGSRIVFTGIYWQAFMALREQAKNNGVADMNDAPFYEVVLEKRDDNAYLVTGNIKHFPKEPFIVTPRELLNILNSK